MNHKSTYQYANVFYSAFYRFMMISIALLIHDLRDLRRNLQKQLIFYAMMRDCALFAINKVMRSYMFETHYELSIYIISNYDKRY